MPTQAGELVDRVLNRVRDASATGPKRDAIRGLLTHGQRLVNAKYGLVIEDVAIATPPRQVAFPIAGLTPSALRIVGVQYEGRDLTEVEWRSFWYLHRTWLRDVSMRPESFALCGRDLLFVYPGAPEPRTLTLRTALRTATLDSDLTDVEIPKEFHALLVDIVCAVVLVRGRTYGTLKDLQESIATRLEQA